MFAVLLPMVRVIGQRGRSHAKRSRGLAIVCALFSNINVHVLKACLYYSYMGAQLQDKC